MQERKILRGVWRNRNSGTQRLSPPLSERENIRDICFTPWMQCMSAYWDDEPILTTHPRRSMGPYSRPASEYNTISALWSPRTETRFRKKSRIRRSDPIFTSTSTKPEYSTSDNSHGPEVRSHHLSLLRHRMRHVSCRTGRKGFGRCTLHTFSGERRKTLPPRHARMRVYNQSKTPEPASEP